MNVNDPDFYRRRSRKVNMSPVDQYFGLGAEDPVLCFSIGTFIWVQRIRWSSAPKLWGQRIQVSFCLGAEDPVLSFRIVTSIWGQRIYQIIKTTNFSVSLTSQRFWWPVWCRSWSGQLGQLCRRCRLVDSLDKFDLGVICWSVWANLTWVPSGGQFGNCYVWPPSVTP